jgi:hypothetical protein
MLSIVGVNISMFCLFFIYNNYINISHLTIMTVINKLIYEYNLIPIK